MLSGNITTNTITCFDTIALNNNLPLQLKEVQGKNENVATSLLVDEYLPVGTNLITCDDISEVDKVFVIEDAKIAYKIENNRSLYNVGQMTYDVKTEGNTGGKVSDSLTVNRFANAEITWTIEKDYMLDKVLVDDIEIEVSENFFVLNDIRKNHMVKVLFKKIPGVIQDDVQVEKNPDANLPDVKPSIPKDKIDLILSDEDKAMIADGKSINFGVSVDAIPIIPTAAKIELEKVIDKENVLLNLDVGMFKKIDGNEYNITDLNVAIRITIDIPKEFVNQANGKNFAIVRTHKNPDGSYTSLLLKDLDNDVNTITFETNQFSMYSLVYDLPKGTIFANTNPSGVATGDNSAINIYSLLLLSASCTLLLIYLNKKRNI